MLNIALAQINPTVGDFEANLQRIEEYCLAAQTQGAGLVVFPELSVTGYYPGDLLDSEDFLRQCELALVRLEALSDRLGSGLTLVVGMPTPNRGAGGKWLFNSLLVLQGGRVVREYHKQLLPTYNIFDERRHFEPGADVACVARVQGARVGFVICEDAWASVETQYAVDPLRRLQEAQVDLVVSINASPSNLGKQGVRRELFERVSRMTALPLVYVNQVGGQDSVVFDGASFAVDPRQGFVAQCESFAEELRVLQFDPQAQAFSQQGQALQALPPSTMPKAEFYRQQIILGLRDYARRCGFTRAVVGSSGGIDSALTLALATQALGAENVVALAMPSSISSEGSVVDSLALAHNLGIEHVVVPISAQVQAFQQVNQASLFRPLEGLALENLQARVRGAILMSYSNANGHLVLTTGNKSEISVGYCTLYGDTNGGLGLIGDLYKTEVYALARHVNEQADQELIPRSILEKEPSAELAPGQLDRDSLPPYDELDVMLKWLIEGRQLPAEEFEQVSHAFGLLVRSKPEEVGRVRRLIAASEYKRRQAAPLLRLRARAFGNGRQIPITAKQYF